MLFLNQQKLDFLYLKERYLRFLLLAIFLLFVFVMFYFYYRFQEARLVEYRTSLKVPIIGIFKSGTSSKGGAWCFIEVENQAVIPIRCLNELYIPGQKVRLTKVINKTGDYYYKINDLP
jgi:hypothetical protein